MAAVMTGGCSRNAGEGSGDPLPQITVSIPPLEYFARAIGGDSISVTTLLPAGTDPETFDPGTSVMRALGKSGALAVTGTLPFEEALTANLRANNSGLRIFDTGKGIVPIYGTHSHSAAEAEHHRDAGDHASHSSEEVDPHIWTSVKNASVIARNMLNALTEIAPEHAPYYQSRYDNLTGRLDSLDRALTQRLDTLPSRAFLIWHPSLSYFSRDYGLEQIALNTENKESSSQQLMAVLARARRENPSAFLLPEGTDSRQAETITAATGLRPVTVSLMSADWEKSIVDVADALSGRK